MAEGGLTRDYRCGYCYQSFDSMTDPRELPCHHVFCKTCIQEDHSNHGNVRCRSCQKVYNLETFDDLPEVKVAAETADADLSTTCDGYDCDGQVAVSYCIDCTSRMCEKHSQIHTSFFGKKHEEIAIGSYLLSPKQHGKEVCIEHGSEVVELCETCHKKFCKKCDFVAESCTGTGCEHRFRSLVSLKKEVTAHYNHLLQAVNDKLTEICKLDKQLWRTLDDEEVECKKRIEMVDKLRDEQIKLVTEESERLKEHIREYERKLTVEIESRNNQLMDKKEQLETCCREVQGWLRNSQVTEQVVKKQETTQKLQNASNVRLPYQLRKISYTMRAGSNLILDTNLVILPAQLNTKLTHRCRLSGHPWYSAMHGPDGGLLLAHHSGVMSLTTSRRLVFDSAIKSIATDCDGFYFVCHARVSAQSQRSADILEVKAISHNNEWTHQVFTFNHSQDDNPSIAVNDRYIIATSSSKAIKPLIVYNRGTKSKKIMALNVAPLNVRFAQNGDLLVISDKEPRCLMRYRLEEGRLSCIWTCKDLEDARSLVTDANGIIYVITNKQKMHVVSPKGEKLQLVHSDKLPANPGEISLRGNELAVPSSSGVSVFEIHH